MENEVHRSADAQTVISQALQERAAALGLDPETVLKVTNGADTEGIRPQPMAAARHQLGLPEDGKILVYAGQAPIDMDLLWNSFACIDRRKKGEVYLLVLGKKWRLPETLGDARGRILQPGFVGRDAYPSYLACGDVMLLPLRRKPLNEARWPGKFGDYLAAGRPIVANPTGEVGRIMETVPVGLLAGESPEEFGETVLALLADPAAGQKMGARARQLAEDDSAGRPSSAPFRISTAEFADPDPDGADVLKILVPDHKEPPVIRIEPLRHWGFPDLAEVWRRRELIFFLFWRDLKVRYKQALLGAAWAILSPLLLMGVFTLFFGIIFATPSEGIPRPVFIFAGVLTWIFFAEALSSASYSLRKEKHLLAKLFFPRIILPLSSLLTPLVDYGLGLLALAVMTIGYGLPIRPTVLLIPVFAVLVLYIALSVGIWLSPLNVQYTDFHHLTPLLIQTWFYATSIFYPVDLIPQSWQWLYRMNPMVGIVEGVRWAVFGTAPPDLGGFLLPFLPVTLILLGGAVYFTRVESKLPELG